MSYSTKYKQLRKAILKRDDYTCAYCGQEATTVDHIIPISKGGVDHESNLTSACATCNYGKKDRDAKTFSEKKYAERFTKIKNKNDMAYRKVISVFNEIKILIKERLGR